MPVKGYTAAGNLTHISHRCRAYSQTWSLGTTGRSSAAAQIYLPEINMQLAILRRGW